MARKMVGHVELRWTCPNCNGVNLGSVRLCGNCGSPQPENVQFYQASTGVLLEDETKIAAAEAGADIHCPYCGARNPASTKVCHQCGGDLTKGNPRESGRVLGAHKTGNVTLIKCINCGAENPDTATNCSQCGVGLIQPDQENILPVQSVKSKRFSPVVIGVIVAMVILACGGIIYLMTLAGRTQDLTGTVQSVQWQRSIPIEALVPITSTAWEDEIPAGADVETCRDEVRYIQDEPAANAVEVCGTPFTVDTGGGFGEVVQDCEYEVYDSFCTYLIDQWQRVDIATITGFDHSPIWPEPQIQADQRLGEAAQETYIIVFSTSKDTYEFTTGDLNLFQQAQVGSQWNLNVNGFGNVVSIDN